MQIRWKFNEVSNLPQTKCMGRLTNAMVTLLTLFQVHLVGSDYLRHRHAHIQHSHQFIQNRSHNSHSNHNNNNNNHNHVNSVHSYDYEGEKTGLFTRLNLSLTNLQSNLTDMSQSPYVVPNIVHFVHLNALSSKSPEDLSYFETINLLSIVANLQPEILFFYCIEAQLPPPNAPNWQLWHNVTKTLYHKKRATESGGGGGGGEDGGVEYDYDYITKIVLVYIDPLKDFKIYNYEPTNLMFKSDIIRMKALLWFGGIYVDSDVLVLNSLDEYRYHDLTVGREGKIMN